MLRFLILAFQDNGHGEEAAGHAAGGAHSEVIDVANWLPSVTAIVVFLVAFGFLYWKVWPQIIKGLDDREKKIRDEIESAEEAREQAKAALAEYERSLADAREEAGQMIAKAKTDAKAVADELRSRNEAELTEMKDRATRDISSAKQAAISELHDEAASLAAAVAAKILQREISAADQQQLVDESIRELSSITAS